MLLLHPEVASRDCGDCQKWLYDDKPTRMGEQLMRGGKPVPRIPGQRPRCEWCPKVPRGAEPVPASAVELSEKNRAAYCHYLECRATGQFPSDPIVRRNAMVFRQIEDVAAEVRRSDAEQRGILMGLQILRKNG